MCGIRCASTGYSELREHRTHRHNSRHPFKHRRDVGEVATTPRSLSLQPESIYHQTDGFSLNKHGVVVWRWRSLHVSQRKAQTGASAEQTGQPRRRWSAKMISAALSRSSLSDVYVPPPPQSLPPRRSIYDGISIYTQTHHTYHPWGRISFTNTLSLLKRLTWKWIQRVSCTHSTEGLNTPNKKIKAHSVWMYHTSPRTRNPGSCTSCFQRADKLQRNTLVWAGNAFNIKGCDRTS